MYYVMLSRRKLGRAKIGYSNKPDRRKEQVGADVVIKFAVPFEAWSQSVECVLHIIFAWASSKERKSDGSTEWFYAVNVLTPMALYKLGVSWWWVGFVPLPFDILAVCFLMMILTFAVILAAMVAVLFVFNYLTNNF